ncbi:hypothetical protein L207DRAFT_635337 [Hyaloscypha variabilis F]|uniref:Uncharacterized protein n=1 Tax=Hyaloscypha variabilis (strain UAMH 11265 / GT02V1 / F) TaxID=1149755 RepID=A0A2J6RHA6_HYAVF|nr:hypothetical protein L207DRAFT_635337 [Hyaloscypha variabilis F]
MSRFRWSQQESDEARLPEGMRRVGYDADTQTYTYQDHHGSSWEGAPGAKYGVLNRTGHVRFETETKEDDAQEKLYSADGPRKQLLGVLSSGFGRLLNLARDLISQATTKQPSNPGDKILPPLPGKIRSKKQPQRYPQRHTQRRRRRPEKWHGK